MKEKIFQKLTSRKLWIAVVGIVVGIAAAFGIEDAEWAQVAGIITSAVSVFSYIRGESSIDAANVPAQIAPAEDEGDDLDA